jgi:DNA-binding NtrC family response regulator
MLETQYADSSPETTSLKSPQVLIVDDNVVNLDLLGQMLEAQGLRVLSAPSGEIALRIATAAGPDLVILDVMMPDIDGYETCRRLKADPRTSHLPVIFATARDDAPSLVRAFEAGGVDYINKPLRQEEVTARVRAHLQISRLTRELIDMNRQLTQRSTELTETVATLESEIRQRKRVEEALDTADQKLSAISNLEAERWGIPAFVGQSKTIGKILVDIRRLHNFGSVNVLVTGESGTGKELVARAIHFGSTRSKGPFIAVNCVAIPEELAESILFGHVRGAFTGATMDRKGYFELADGGTLFLDEIGDMPASLQAKLLRVLEDGRVTPLGATKEKQVDVRIVAATNVNLSAQIRTAAFRQDLYFRLAQFLVEVPPLRNRREDIPQLAAHFVRLFAEEMGLPEAQLDPSYLKALSAHDFPGNVRELKNVIERSLIESGGRTLRPDHLLISNKPSHSNLDAPGTSSATPSLETEPLANSLPLNLEAAEAILIKRALAETGGNIAEAARRLGVNRSRIYRKLGETLGGNAELAP